MAIVHMFLHVSAALLASTLLAVTSCAEEDGYRTVLMGCNNA